VGGFGGGGGGGGVGGGGGGGFLGGGGGVGGGGGGVGGVPAGAFAGLVLGGVLMMHHWEGRRDSGEVRVAGRDLAAANVVTETPAQGKAMRDRALPPTGRKVRKVFEKGELSLDLSSAPPLLSRERRAVGEGERERLPKMETFPAVAQSGGFLAEPDGGGTKELREAVDSPQVAQALLELKTQQEKPIEVSAIEIKPL